MELSGEPFKICVPLFVDIMKVDASTRWKISKHHFLKDIENLFNEATHIGLEPHQFFFFLRYLNKYSR